MTKEEMAKAYAEGFSEKYREIAYDAFLCGYGAKCTTEIPKDLEEAAEDFVWEVMENDEDGISDLCRKLQYTSKISDFYDALAEFFVAGAKWQKEQMMKKAVEGEVCIPNVWVEHKEGKELVVRAEISKELGFKFGDKVRIIIVKEDEK